MSTLDDFVLDMDEEDRQNLWERTLLPFPSGNYVECFLGYVKPEEPESNRIRVRNQLKGQTDTIPLDLAYPAIELAVNQSPFETVDLDEESIETTVVDKQQRVKSTEPVLRTLKMIPTAEASNFTDVAEGTVKRWRSGGSQTVPLEFWESYTQKIKDKAEKLDMSSITADLVDYNRYFYGSKSISESMIAEDVPLPKLARFGHLLDAGSPVPKEEINHLVGLMDSNQDPVETDDNVEHYLLKDFIQGEDPEFFESFLDNRNYFSREFAGMTPYKRQQADRIDIEQNSYIEKWYDTLEHIGQPTTEGIYVGVQGVGEIIDTIQNYELDKYGDTYQSTTL